MPTKPDAGASNAGSPAAKKAAAKPTVKAIAGDAKEALGMKRWLRVTARRALSSPKSLGQSGNAAADAAAEAIARMLQEEKKLA